jgi:hypothetical protein
MEGGSSPSRHQEKCSKKTQDHAVVPKPPGRTKASYSRGGAGSFHGHGHGHGDQESSATTHPPAPTPPPAPSPVGAKLMVDEEEEALDHAGRTLAIPPLRTPP